MKKILLMSLFGLWLMPMALAQQQVSGTVIDYSTQEALPGVNIIIQGTTTGTITDIDGHFALEVPSNESVLSFSSIGSETQEITVGNSANVSIRLIPDLTTLKERAVEGYTVKKKKVIRGAGVEVGG